MEKAENVDLCKNLFHIDIIVLFYIYYTGVVMSLSTFYTSAFTRDQ